MTPSHPEITVANGAIAPTPRTRCRSPRSSTPPNVSPTYRSVCAKASVDASLCDDIEGAAREIYEVCGLGTPNFATPAAEQVPSDEARAAIVAPGGQTPPATVMTSEALDAVRPAMDDGAGFQSPVASSADDMPRWHIEGPDFLFQPAAKEPDQESIEPASRPERQHALLPQTLFQPGPKDDPADLFDAAGSSVAVSAAAAPQSWCRSFCSNFCPERAAGGIAAGCITRRDKRGGASAVAPGVKRPTRDDTRPLGRRADCVVRVTRTRVGSFIPLIPA